MFIHEAYLPLKEKTKQSHTEPAKLQVRPGEFRKILKCTVAK